MRSQNKFVCAFFFVASPCLAGTFFVPAASPGPWPLILSSVGHAPAAQGAADIYVAPQNAPASPDWRAKAMNGAAIILEGSSPLASSFGFIPTATTISSLHVVDEHNPVLPIVW